MGGNSGGGQNEVETLENEQPCSFSSVVEVTAGNLRRVDGVSS